jgi:hypothetical protein
MNPVDVYRILPKKNCGECPPATCIAFAVSITRGDAKVEECPYLDEGIRQKLSELKPVNWRDELVKRLQKDVRQLDFKQIYRDIGAEIEGDSLRVTCFGTEYTVSPDGEVTSEGYINSWIKALLLHYIRTWGRGRLSGRWVSFSELKSGMIKASSFSRDCEEPLRRLFDTYFPTIESVLNRIGAERIRHEATEYAWRLYALPKIPVLILYWKAEDDTEESSLRVLFDRSADRFLDVESLVFLIEGLVNILSRCSESPKKAMK